MTTTGLNFTATPPLFFQKQHVFPKQPETPLDCSTSALNLCLRKESKTPTPENSFFSMQKPDYLRPETPSSTSTLSPNSEASSDACGDLPAITKVKVTRPFKAYTRDPLALAAETILGRDSAEAYAEFRKRMLATTQQSYSATNKNMRRTIATGNNTHISDPSYWEKRRKNNEAAKRSRDARKAKEDEIAIRCAFLEQENIRLKYEVAALRDEAQRYRLALR